MPSNAGSVAILNARKKRARSAWAAQHRKVKKGIRAEFAESTKNPKLHELVKFSLKGPEGATQKDKIEFLRKNKNILKKVIRKAVGPIGKRERMLDAEDIVREIEKGENIPEGMVDDLISKVIGENLDKELWNHGDKLNRRLRKYIKQRKIPFDKDILEHSVSVSLATGELGRLGAGVDLAKFERNYIGSLKQKRAFELNSARFDNMISGKALRGLKLTANQKGSMKRWLRKKREVISKEFKEKIRDPKISLNEIERLADIQIEQLSKEMRIEAINNFSKQQRAKEVAVENLRAAMRTSGTTKQGNRADRMAAYVPVEKKLAERVDGLRKKEDAARVSGRKFDPARFALSEIELSSPETADLLRGMLNRGVLNRGSVRKLYESGSLSQRVFVSAIMEHGFIRAFGEKQVNALARGVSHIGAVGKKIPVARKAFQSTQSSELFKFLKKADLIETHHGGGEVVYLHRPQTHYGSIGK